MDKDSDKTHQLSDLYLCFLETFASSLDNLKEEGCLDDLKDMIL
jgi:hypothetical protein